jgi:hypothetical protein
LIKLVTLFLLISSTLASADSISFHLFRSPLGINWSTPWLMTFSTLKNSLANTHGMRAYAISHVFVELNCQASGVHIYRGQTSTDDSNERELIFKEKYGMGVMFHSYKGKFEKDESILKDMAPYEGSERRGTFTALISPQTCQRMLNYVQEYEDRGYGHMYSGLQADPLKGEGAGCSAFAMSFLRIAGLVESFTDHWKNIIDVPKRFVGGPLTGQKVNILKILTHPAAKWSNKEPHIHLEAWNPERMLEWVQKTHDHIQHGGLLNDYQTQINSVGDSKEVIVDLSHKPTPTGSFWLN